jgi:lysophospholipase L1-like esterase
MKSPKYYLLFSSVLCTLLGCSVFLNFRLYHQAKQYYFELNETRLDPVGIRYYPPQSNQITHAQSLRVVLLGDSRAAGWHLPNLDGYGLINRGIGSQTSVQTVARFSAHVQPLNPDVVVIQVGINDLKTVALFPQRRDEIVANCKANIQQIVQASKQSGARVILTTIFPVGDVPLERRPFWSDAIATAIQEVNAYILTLADEQTIVFDTFALLTNPQGVMRPEYSKDELHLNHRGYTVLNQTLIPLLDSTPSVK